MQGFGQGTLFLLRVKELGIPYGDRHLISEGLDFQWVIRLKSPGLLALVFESAYDLLADEQVQHKLRRPGAFAYRFADETTWELTAGRYFVLTHSRSLAVQALFTADRKGLDSLAGTAQADTGASVRYLGARVAGTLGRRFESDVSVELPVRIRTTDTMVVPDYRIRAALNWRF